MFHAHLHYVDDLVLIFWRIIINIFFREIRYVYSMNMCLAASYAITAPVVLSIFLAKALSSSSAVPMQTSFLILFFFSQRQGKKPEGAFPC